MLFYALFLWLDSQAAVCSTRFKLFSYSHHEEQMWVSNQTGIPYIIIVACNHLQIYCCSCLVVIGTKFSKKCSFCIYTVKTSCSFLGCFEIHWLKVIFLTGKFISTVSVSLVLLLKVNKKVICYSPLLGENTRISNLSLHVFRSVKRL